MLSQGAFPEATVVRFEDAGHFVPEEKPDELIGRIKDLIRSHYEPGIPVV